jgi:protein-tyrosine phosphatase
MLDDLFGKPTAPPGPPTILFVCTGNICRSPLAEKVLRARLEGTQNEGVVVASAGLQGVVGAPMDGLPEQIAKRAGADTDHAARQINTGILRASTLVITMTRSQRSEIAREFPFALKRTFTLSEFVRLLGEHPAEVPLPGAVAGRGLFETVLDASRFRGMVTLSDSDDIEDPYRRSDETHERVGARIIELVDMMARQITHAR